MKETQKIKLIEAPFDENQEIFRQELEEALGGWNCGSYDNVNCVPYVSGDCIVGGAGTDYCAQHTCVIYKRK